MQPYDLRRPFKALIVEDDRFFQEVIKMAIHQNVPHHDIQVCQELKQALNLIQRHPHDYQLVVVDLNLPDGDGCHVIRQVAKQMPNTLIMVVSLIAQEHKVLKAIRAGATGFVIKGDTTLSVTQAIHQLLHGIKPLSSRLNGYFLKLVGKEPPSHFELPTTKPLTARELDLLRAFAKGQSYQQAAHSMDISLTTVQTHTRNLYRKLHVNSSLRALSKAKEFGMI